MSKKPDLRCRAVFPGLLGGDLRALGSHGMPWAHLLVGALCVLALRLLSADARAVARPLLPLALPALPGAWLIGAVILSEKDARVQPALWVTRMRPGQYLFSKLIASALPCVLAGALVAWLGNAGGLEPPTFEPLALALTAALLLLACLLILSAALIAARLARSPGRYALWLLPAELLLLGPAVWDALSPLPAWAGYHPVVWLARQMASPLTLLSDWAAPDPLPAAEALGAVQPLQAAALLVWLTLTLLLARLAVRGMLTSRKEVRP